MRVPKQEKGARLPAVTPNPKELTTVYHSPSAKATQNLKGCFSND